MYSKANTKPRKASQEVNKVSLKRLKKMKPSKAKKQPEKAKEKEAFKG